MGLDIMIYNSEDIKVGMYEISPNLHDAIFVNTNNWGSYLYLRKIKDYYKADVEFQKDDLAKFIIDLKQMTMFISPTNRPALESLIGLLSEKSI